MFLNLIWLCFLPATPKHPSLRAFLDKYIMLRLNNTLVIFFLNKFTMFKKIRRLKETGIFTVTQNNKKF